MIHQGQRLPLGLEPRHHLLGVHAQLDDLECDAASDGFALFGGPDRAEAAFALDPLSEAETMQMVRDLLAAADWFFPGGMNHHEMFTWNEAVNKVMQKVARRIAGQA